MLTRPGRMDEMTVRVERRRDAPPELAASAGGRLRDLVKATIGVTVGVEVVEPDSIERSMGKMRRIVDLRPAPPA